MMTTNAEQLSRLFLCLGFGVWLNLYYRLWNLFPPRGAHRPLKQFIRDWLFAVSGAVMFFLFSLAISAGIVRLGMLVAAGVGFIVANRTVGRLFSACLRTLHRLWNALAVHIAAVTEHFTARCRSVFKKILFFSKKVLHSLYTLVYNRER